LHGHAAHVPPALMLADFGVLKSHGPKANLE